ncbi:hypothetical protein [Microvirga pudoricolor]|uniref:hypothetical protein n=1 Tax=Microvirga pudoricolor TaxID=2778729 RepID=UPI00194DDA0B|nr:hypothetical protein [Microvirga pudoricolor]MBM6595016.1 hypothetical protein [Microvirga pudoricolor]
MKRLGLKGFLIGVLGLIASLQPSAAAEPVYPPASRIGIVPPKDMVPSRRFSGFENPERAAGISFVEMPAAAYPELVTGLSNTALKGQGMDVKSRETIRVDGRQALLISGSLLGPSGGRKWVLAVKDQGLTALLIAQVAGGGDGYSDAQMRDALKSVSLRGPISMDEQVSALPFRINDRAGFRPVRVLAGNSILFTEGPKDTVKGVEQPVMILAASLQPPPQSPERQRQFAQAALNANRILKDISVERSESFRLKGQDWHEIVAKATDAATNQPMIVTQTIRFEPDRYVRMVGMTRPDQRDSNLPRFRTVIDSVDMNP